MRFALAMFLLTTALPLVAQPILQVNLISPTGPVVTHQQSAAGTQRDFGDRDTAAGPSAPLTVFVTNAGTGTLSLSQAYAGGTWWDQYVVNSAGMQLQLSAGQSTSFTVAFDPSTIGQKPAYFRMAHSDTTQASPFYLSVDGKGTGTAAPPPVMSLEYAGATITSSPFYVGTVPTQTLSSLTFTIRNSGGGDLLLQGPEYLAIMVAGSCSAAVSTMPAALIAPGATSDFTIDVTPSSQNSWMYMFRIASNDGGSWYITIEGDVPVVATELRFVIQPAGALAGAPFSTSAVVAITDATGAVDTTDNSTVVQVSITAGTGTAGAMLGGTTSVTAVNGFVTFTDLEIDLAGVAYSLTFVDMSGSLTGTTSLPFDVTVSGTTGSGKGQADEEGCSLSAPHSGLAPVVLMFAILLRSRRRKAAGR